MKHESYMWQKGEEMKLERRWDKGAERRRCDERTGQERKRKERRGNEMIDDDKYNDDRCQDKCILLYNDDNTLNWIGVTAKEK